MFQIRNTWFEVIASPLCRAMVASALMKTIIQTSMLIASAATGLSFLVACGDSDTDGTTTAASTTGTTTSTTTGGGNGGEGGSGGDTGVGGGGAGGSSGTGGAAPGSDLNGTWATPCFDAGNGTYAVTTLNYQDLALVGNYSEYGDATCTMKVHTSDWTGTSTITGMTANGETKIDIAFASFKSTALTAENADLNNNYMYCGFADWAKDVEKDVLGANCYGFSIPVGGKSLDIYKVSGDTLTFGMGAKIGTDLMESDRPTMLNPQGAFTKKK